MYVTWVSANNRDDYGDRRDAGQNQVHIKEKKAFNLLLSTIIVILINC